MLGGKIRLTYNFVCKKLHRSSQSFALREIGRHVWPGKRNGGGTHVLNSPAAAPVAAPPSPSVNLKFHASVNPPAARPSLKALAA